MVAQKASKKAPAGTPAQVVMAALQREIPVKGYRRVAIEGTSGKVWITQAPDGHVFTQFTPTPNPKSNMTFGNSDKVKLLQTVLPSIIKATEVVEAINASMEGSTHISGVTKSEPTGVRL